jgi:hypothetical protein
MRLCLNLLGLLALALVIVPSCLAFEAGTGLSQTMKSLMLVGTLLWFATATPLNLMRRTAPTRNLPPQETR